MPAARFSVVARRDPQLLVRMLNYFAQLGLIPSRVHAVETDGLVTISIEQHGLAEQQTRIIAEKMRSAVLVEAVHIYRGRRLLRSFNDGIDAIAAA